MTNLLSILILLKIAERIESKIEAKKAKQKTRSEASCQNMIWDKMNKSKLEVSNRANSVNFVEIRQKLPKICRKQAQSRHLWQYDAAKFTKFSYMIAYITLNRM